MRLFIIDKKYLMSVTNSLTIDSHIKELMLAVILKFDHSLVDFIYNSLTMYTTYYVSVKDENSFLNNKDISKIIFEFNTHNVTPNVENVVVADSFDILYSNVGEGCNKFNNYFQEEIFTRLEKLEGSEKAYLYLDEVFTGLSELFFEVEESFISSLLRTDELSNLATIYEGCNLVTIYAELFNGFLMLYIL